MKKSLFFVIAFSLMGYHLKGQSSIQELGFNEYGVVGSIHVPQFPDRFRSTLGYGAGMQANYQFNQELSLLGRLAFRSLTHTNLDLNETSIVQDVNLTIAGGINLRKLSGTKFLLGVQPTRVGGILTNVAPDDFVDFKNLNTLNIFGGLQVDLNSYTKLEFNYTLPIRKQHYASYIDAIPSVVSVGLTTNFNTISNRVNHWREMKKTLNSLKTDTLYFINRACEGELTDKRLEELLSAYYTFSAFKVLREVDVDNGLLPDNPIHFAVIGQFYAGKGEPLTTGIYLLDKDMLNVKFPYEMYVPIYNSNLNCMGNEGNIIGGIVRFNTSLGR